ncbi:MAG: citrate/2-methylcitrate synthase, partial [Thermodesulfobacteriota bacterium]
KEKIMGIGHRVYKTKDPRARILQKYAHKLFDHSGASNVGILDVAEEVEKVVQERLAAKGLYPNVDFYSGIVFQAMGMPPEISTPIFAMARVSGWLAHWEEQLKSNRIYRPSQKYIGERKFSYVSLENR